MDNHGGSHTKIQKRRFSEQTTSELDEQLVQAETVRQMINLLEGTCFISFGLSKTGVVCGAFRMSGHRQRRYRVRRGANPTTMEASSPGRQWASI